MKILKLRTTISKININWMGISALATEEEKSVNLEISQYKLSKLKLIKNEQSSVICGYQVGNHICN